MTKITKEEVLKIAEISHLSLREDEVDAMVQHLQEVLSYAERVEEIVADVQEPSNKNVNIFREDVVVAHDSKVIIQQAPQQEENFFVVPVIIDNK